jgi:hypothetical protein
MMIQLKIKALKSVLDANPHEKEDDLTSSKKAKRLKKKPKLVIISSDSDEDNNEMCIARISSQKNRFKHKLNKKSKYNLAYYIFMSKVIFLKFLKPKAK